MSYKGFKSRWKRAKWIRAIDFALKYDINIKQIYVFKYQNTKEPFKRIGRELYVNEDFFKRRNDFKAKVIEKARENYYVITDEISAYRLAKILGELSNKSQGCWVTWMYKVLFAQKRQNILCYTVDRVMWEFYKLTNHIIKDKELR